VETGEPLLWIHAASSAAANTVRERLQAAYRYSNERVEPPRLIHSIIR
jgi:thymidine phosphorylase